MEPFQNFIAFQFSFNIARSSDTGPCLKIKSTQNVLISKVVLVFSYISLASSSC